MATIWNHFDEVSDFTTLSDDQKLDKEYYQLSIDNLGLAVENYQLEIKSLKFSKSVKESNDNFSDATLRKAISDLEKHVEEKDQYISQLQVKNRLLEGDNARLIKEKDQYSSK